MSYYCNRTLWNIYSSCCPIFIVLQPASTVSQLREKKSWLNLMISFAMWIWWAIFYFPRSLLQFTLEVLWVLQVWASLYVTCLYFTENVHPHFLSNDLCLSPLLHELMFHCTITEDQMIKIATIFPPSAGQKPVGSIFRMPLRGRTAL